MVAIGTIEKKAAQAEANKPTFSKDCTMNSYPAELLTVKISTPITFAKKEIKVLTPAIQGSGQKMPFFQYIEVDFNGVHYGARVMLTGEDKQITGQEKEVTLKWRGPTVYGPRVIMGMSV